MSDPVLLFLASVAVYSVLPLVIALLPERYRYLLLYAHIAGVLVLGGLLGAVYVLPIRGDVALLAGQVSYGGFMFASLVTVVVGRDVRVLRNVFVLTVAIDLLVYVVFLVSHRALTTEGVPNPFGTAPDVFDQSLRIVVFGGLLILAELVVLVALLELAKRSLGPLAMAPAYVLSYVAVLVLDGVLFPTLVLLPPEGLTDFIRAGVQAKLVLAGAFAVPLAVFVAFYRPAVARFEETPIDLRGILSRSPEQLLVDLDRQQAELEEERARLLRTRRHAGQATATVEGILGATTSIVLVATDADLRITHVNPGAHHVLGYSEEEVLGTTPTRYLELDQRAKARGFTSAAELVDAYAARGEHHDWVVRRKDGQPRTLSIGVSAIEVDDEVVGYLFAGEDVTARVQAEQAYAEAMRREQESQVRLQEAERLKVDLVRTVSHELRTPLTTISASGALLLEDESLIGRQRQGVERIVRSADRLGGLVEDLTTLSRIDRADPATADQQDLDLRDVPTGPVGLLSAIAHSHGLSLDVDLPPHRVPCRGDFASLERVVAHLLSNAIKFNRADGRVRVSVDRDDGVARLTVSDTGIGITEEDRATLFSRFARGEDAEVRADQGAGLGLSLVDEIVAAHQGRVDLQSTPGQGTTVVVELPAAT